MYKKSLGVTGTNAYDYFIESTTIWLTIGKLEYLKQTKIYVYLIT